MYDEYPGLDSQIKKLNLGDYLEFGCGGGGFLKYVLGQNLSFETVTAVDIDPDSVEKARDELAGLDIRFIVQEKLPLDIEADHFATITLSNTLHHLRDKKAVLGELKRLIKPQGQIIITEMVSNDLSEAEQSYCRFHALRAEVEQLNGTYHDTTYTSSEIEDFVLNSGLRIDKKHMILNEKQVIRDEVEVSRVELILEDLVQGEIDRAEYEMLADKAESIKDNLRQFGIKRPRQLYLETSP